jgi:YHS domain-containing protein
MRRGRLIAARSLLFALLCSTFLPAGANALPPVNVDARGAAVKGYDVVAYFTVGEPVAGSSEISFDWNGAGWWFSKQKHLELFRGDPEKYAPRYGGY